MVPQKTIEVFETLTNKQLEAMVLAAQHLTSKQIARELGVSPATIDKRIEAIRARLDQMPRSEVLRQFIQWAQTSDQVIAEFFPLTGNPEVDAFPAMQPDGATFEFHDSVTLDQRASWDRQADWRPPWIELSNMGSLGRMGAMAVGSIVLVIGFILVVTSAQAIENLLGI